MKIALLGLGGMGSVVRRVALERGHEVPVIVDPGAKFGQPRGVDGGVSGGGGGECGLSRGGGGGDCGVTVGNSLISRKLTPDILSDIDVVIDFSLGSAVLDNVRICVKAGKNIVVGATGWYEKMEEVRGMVEGGERAKKSLRKNKEGVEIEKGLRDDVAEEGENQSLIGFLWSSNFSIGVNLYFRIIEEAAKMMNQFDEYDVWGHEIHHFNKADSPSGTAKMLGDILTKNIERKTSVVTERLDRKRAPEEIHFSSLRGGAVNFGHTIGFDSAADRILITHEARNRDGYALGAVKAAEWLKERKGFFEMKDFLGF